ncbi:MAG: YdjY domain-containing protein [Thermoguttaceae bacterium]|jgi:uncharacterized repeat protein (TIGR01451 family)|nr:YdjY domain-containing protein [Thermoguttaceae bacterium]
MMEPLCVRLRAARLAAAAIVLIGVSQAGAQTSAVDPPKTGAAAAAEPKIEVVVVGPKTATVGDDVSFAIVITNRSDKPVAGLLVTDRFSRGLEHAASPTQVERDIDKIDAGRSVPLRITLRVTQPGELSHTVSVYSDGKVLASARADVKALGKSETAASEKTAPTTTPMVKPEPKPEAKPEQKPEPKPEAKPEPKPEAKPEAKAETKPAPATEPKGEAKPEAKPVMPESSRLPKEGPAAVTAPGEAKGHEPGQVAPEASEVPDLGPPLVDNLAELKQLHPEFPVWIDRKGCRVVMVGAVCARQVPLELLVCPLGSKEHESVLVVPVKPSLVHIGLLALGVEPGHPVQYQPKYVPASGPEIEVTLIWKDEKGTRKTARGQDWVRNVKTKQAMEHPWVFAGSDWIDNPYTKRKEYRADVEGYLICVSNFPGALLDLPVASSADDSELLFDAFTERIPHKGTPVTIVLAPKKPPAAAGAAEPKEPPKKEAPPAK